MIRFYPLIILLQLFCLYHAYSNKTEQKWYWIIIFFPFLGSIFYLYQTFYSRANLENLTEEVKNTFVSNYKIDKLEKQLVYSDTVSNKIELADEHSIAGNYDRALELYKSCMTGLYKDDTTLIMKIVRNSYLNKDYASATKYGEQIISKKIFANSEEKIAFAWSYYHQDKMELATQNFEEIDQRFSNYKHRLEYAKFLNLSNKPGEAKEKLEELLNEINSMDRYEQRLKKDIHKQIKNLHHQIA